MAERNPCLLMGIQSVLKGCDLIASCRVPSGRSSCMHATRGDTLHCVLNPWHSISRFQREEDVLNSSLTTPFYFTALIFGRDPFLTARISIVELQRIL